MADARVSRSTSGNWNKVTSKKSVVNGEKRNNDSCWATIEEHAYFRTATLLVIVLNAVWIAIDTQWNHSRLMRADGKLPLEPFSLITEHFFCTYFTLELVIRFLALRQKCRTWFRDPWFVFDLFLVLFMVLETWILPIVRMAQGNSGSDGALAGFSSFRLLRLLRLTRMAKLMRFFPELLTLMRSIASATQAVFFILVFLIGVIYVFAIIFTTQISPAPHEPVESDPDADPTAKELFSDIGSSMMTLFTNGVLGDNLAQTVNSIKDENLWMMWLFLVFFIISSITLLNMLVGVLCEVIENSSKEEVEQSQVLELRSTLTRVFKKADHSLDGLICEAEWATIKQSEEVRGLLERLGVEESQIDGRLDKMQEVVFGAHTGEKQSRGICFEEFVNKIVELRWDTPAKALDVEVLKNVVMKEDMLMTKKLEQIESSLRQLANSPICTPREHVSAIGGHLLDSLAHEERLGKPLSWLKEVPDDFLLHVLRSRD